MEELKQEEFIVDLLYAVDRIQNEKYEGLKDLVQFCDKHNINIYQNR